MSDRELLELAAKAAGMNVSWDHYDPDYCARAEGMFLNGERSPDNSKYWNPLTDDGDALRLSVKLRMHARQFPVLDDGMDAPLGMVEVWRVDDDDPLHVEFLRNGDDRLAATRRAIVRAAAEIGRSMK